MRIVVHDKRFKHSLQPKYTLDLKLDYKLIPGDLKLADNAINHYIKSHNAIGYAEFDTLAELDIKSVLSAVKRQEAHLNVDRMGNVAFYHLNNQ
jgi:hypothetical protein